jgi:serine protease inhibitor
LLGVDVQSFRGRVGSVDRLDEPGEDDAQKNRMDANRSSCIMSRGMLGNGLSRPLRVLRHTETSRRRGGFQIVRATPKEVDVMKGHRLTREIWGLVLFAAVISVLVVGCTSDGVAPAGDDRSDPKRVSPGDVDRRLVEANTRFAFNLFSELVSDGATENIFVSPPSISFALSMTLNGAAGETYEAMANALEAGELSAEEINHANATLMAWLEQAEPKVVLSIANSLWAREGIPFYPAFLKANETYFDAEVSSLNFRDPASVNRINNWVSEETHERITEIVDSIPAEAILYLINAIYFKGTWATEFDVAKTRDRSFTLLDGASKSHPTMHQFKERHLYLRRDGFQSVSLPYGEDGRIGMYVFLPDKDSSLDEFLGDLSAEAWEEWMSGFYEMEGDLGLPRFEIEYEINLNNVLAALGMGIAFDEYGADFSRMLPVSSTANAYISKVLHKTYVKVNEEGTEAAAVTSVEVGITSIPDRFVMIVDRPFFIAIRDSETGTILFMGAIVEPM